MPGGTSVSWFGNKYVSSSENEELLEMKLAIFTNGRIHCQRPTDRSRARII